MEPILQIKGLEKKFKNFELKNVDLTLEKGYIMGFVGPNGAGKSTTIKLIMNLLKRDSGKINIFGLDNIKDEKEIKNRIGFVYDENYFYEELKVNEMKKVVSRFYKQWDEASFIRYLKTFDLPANRKIKDLSKGMKMKFSLAIALAHNAELLIMDEPTSGLDPVMRSELLEILLDIIQDENKAVLFSTHITSDLDKIADYVTFIDDGKIILSEEKDTIIENFGLVKGPLEILDADIKKSLIGLKESKYGFEGLVKSRSQMSRTFKGKVIIEKPTLEEVMLHLVRREIA